MQIQITCVYIIIYDLSFTVRDCDLLFLFTYASVYPMIVLLIDRLERMFV